MVHLAVAPKDRLALRTRIAEASVHDWGWQVCGVVFGLGGGIIAPLLATTLSAVAWFTGARWHGFFLQRAGTVLFFLAIPLLICGAHCLDLLDKRENRTRSEGER
jgi:hypothetical protein